MDVQQVVIVGAGQGGYQAAASLRQEGYAGRILLIGDEPGLPYQRPPLSKAYLKDGDAARLALRPETFYAESDITLLSGERVGAIDREAAVVETADGTRHAYDHLILATGTRNARPPIPGLDLPGVLAMRTLADADTVRAAVPQARHALVIGGGFIGLEFAAVARAAGLSVTVVEGAPRLMARAVSPATSAHFLAAHRAMGSEVLLGNFVQEILSSQGRAAGVRLADGQQVEGDLVLVAAGVVPNAELAAEAGLATANGVVVDALLQTGDPAISALGDCASFPDPRTGQPVRLESVQAACDHARTIARRLTGNAEPYAAVPWFWSDQGDLRLQIAGLSTGADRFEVRSDVPGTLTVFCFEGEELISVETDNVPKAHMSARRLLGMPDPVRPADLAAVDWDLKALLMARR